MPNFGGALVAPTEFDVVGAYFVAPNFSLGLALGGGWGQVSGQESAVSLRAELRAGYNAPLSKAVSIWVQVGLDYRIGNSQPAQTGSDAIYATAFGVSALAPVLLHPTPGFFVGAGPAFYTDLFDSTKMGNTTQDNAKITSLGLVAMIGGAL